MTSKKETLKNYYRIIKESKCINKREAQMYLSNLEAIAMEVEGFEDLVVEAKQIVKEMKE